MVEDQQIAYPDFNKILQQMSQEQQQKLLDEEYLEKFLSELPQIKQQVQQRDSLLNNNIQLAELILTKQDEIDQLNQQVNPLLNSFRLIQEQIQSLQLQSQEIGGRFTQEAILDELQSRRNNAVQKSRQLLRQTIQDFDGNRKEFLQNQKELKLLELLISSLN